MHRAIAAVVGLFITCSTAVAGQADLTWTAPTKNTDGSTLTNLQGYGIYRRCNTAAIIQIGTVAVPALAYSDINVPDDGRQCWYSLTAVDSTGVASVRTNEVSKVFTAAAQPPGATTTSYTWVTQSQPPFSAYSIVQTASLMNDDAASLSTSTVTFPNSVTAGNFVIAFAWMSYPSNRYPTSFAGSLGDVGVLYDAPSAIDRVWVMSLKATHADKTFVVGQSGPNLYQRVWIAEVKGAGSVDKTSIVAGANYTTAVDVLATPPIQPAVANEFVLGLGWNISTQAIPNAGTGFTSQFTTVDPASDAGRMEFLTWAPTTPVTVTFTPTQATKHFVSAVLLKPPGTKTSHAHHAQ